MNKSNKVSENRLINIQSINDFFSNISTDNFLHNSEYTIKEIRFKNNQKNITRDRHILSVLKFNETNCLSEAARYVNRTHSNVICSIKKIEEWLQYGDYITKRISKHYEDQTKSVEIFLAVPYCISSISMDQHLQARI